MSLREEDYATTPLFSPSFLDTLMNDHPTRPRELSVDSSIISDFSLNDDIFKFNTNGFHQTITPSAIISNEISTMADWLLEQQQQQLPQEDKQHKRQRRSTDSPLGSSSSASSSSPPITPMQQVSLGFEPIHQLDDIKDTSSLQPLIQNYLLQKHQDYIPGERTIMILTSKVAQKSYGTEKRFLCPPPATIMKGANWWTSDKMADKNQASYFHSQINTAPKLTIQISGEAIQQSGVIEWQTSSGAIIDSKMAAASTHVFGRCVSKQLYINDADEKRKRVEVLAKVQLGNGLHLGTFQSKGIKVISKPSKKRQSVKNMELCIHHGTTISLFNRIRSQTVSTKYLGVSTTASNNSDGNSSNNNGTCFVSRTGAWDPFVIWIVDTSCSSDNVTSRPKHNPLNPSYPPPPAIALQSSTPLAIHYNQPVVLQCVTTGLVSPVMIIRKVDKQSLVLGGNRVDDLGYNKTLGGECGDETLGDPVSQLHKVAFQIVQDPSFHQNGIKQDIDIGHWKIPQSSHPVTYLACLNDVVGMHKTTSTRNLVPACHTQEQQQQPSTTTETASWPDILQEKEPRRRLSNGESKARRGSVGRGNNVDPTGLEGACWTEDVSDAAVWTIVGTDCASYTFWTPDEHMPSSITPFPIIQDISKQQGRLTLTGENFSRDIEVWFGDMKSPQTDYASHNAIHCKIPDNLSNSPTIEEVDHMTKKIPLLFVRGNGVVYRTNFYYTL
ncbi:hypothetical protein CU097_007461 [Rhizopus azygosporus]|uniref:Recombining binding protein suppressor of hairless-like protein n=1 Tax=Rhizopus azygosporus TaxID=86630 RepID=A0A367KCK8_RHIAZ|nr:hypothetical protein CU097_007461 [Rhizopus azygosporus]